jgi:branched-chain amino acid transport system permease protein
MVYNSTSIINFAQGEFVMLGGLLGVTFVSGAKNFGVPAPYAIALGFVLAVGTTTLVGMLMEKVAIEPTDRLTPFHYAGLAIIIFALARILGGLTVGPALAVMIVLTVAAYLLLRRKTLESMRNPSVLQLIIITIALSILIRGIAMFTFGKDPYFMAHFVPEQPINIFGATVLPQTLLVVAAIIVVVILVGLFFGFTLTGKAMKACAFNRDIAKPMGINDRWDDMVLAMSALVGAVAGYLLHPSPFMDYDRGPMLALKGFGRSPRRSGEWLRCSGGLFILGSRSSGNGIDFFRGIRTRSLIIVCGAFLQTQRLFGSAEAAKFKEF